MKKEQPMKTTKRTCTLIAIALALNNLLHSSALAQSAARTRSTNPTQSAFESTLREFVSLAAKDVALSSLLAKHRIALEYTITDLGLQCFVGFDGEKVVGAFGKPERRSELVFVSDSKTLYRVLRGEDCEMDVAVHLNLLRKLSLKRDLKEIRSALARVYELACEKAVAIDSRLAQTTLP